MENINTNKSERALLREDFTTLTLIGEINDVEAYNFIQDSTLLLNTLKDKKGDKEIKIIISSSGGSVDAGLAIVDAITALRRNGIKVIGVVHGTAMSMGCLILQACTERLISSFAWLMMHGISQTGFMEHDLQDSRQFGMFLESVTLQMATLVADKNTSVHEKYRSADFWNTLMQSKTPKFFTANEALDCGLVDRVLDGDICTKT